MRVASVPRLHPNDQGPYASICARSHRGWTLPRRSVGLVRAATLVASVCAPALSQAQPAPPTFSRDVAPIVFARCVRCHHPGGPAPFSLLDYASARPHATQIAAATLSRYMPPRKAEAGHVALIGETRLSEADISVIQRWVKAGALEGERSQLPPTPRVATGWQLGVPDLEVSLPTYTLAADASVGPGSADVFRIFVAAIPVDRLRYVRGFEFRPGGRVVHHATIRVDRTPASRLRDEVDPAAGYDGLLAYSASYPDGHFLGWSPGQLAPFLPRGLAWRLEPGTDVVVELHMRPSGKPETVRSSIGLYFGPDPPERTPTMLRLGRQTFEIPAGATRYVVTDAFELPVDVDALAVQPHAHDLARAIEAVAVLPDRSIRTLIAIRDWDFRWQQVYRFVEPVPLPKGTRVEVRLVYDNSEANPRNPHRPPRRVVWGQRSADEMGDLWLQVLTRNDADRAALGEGFRPKALAEDIAGYLARIRAEPTSPALHDDVALLYLEARRMADAVEHFAASLALAPGSAAAHFNLGTALAFAGRTEEAIAEYRRALEIRPGYALAHNNLGALLLHRGDLAGALAQLQQAVAMDPGNADAQGNLARAYDQQGERALAERHRARAARLRGGSPAGAEPQR